MQNMNENLLEWHKQIKTMEEKNIPVVHVLIKSRAWRKKVVTGFLDFFQEKLKTDYFL